MDSDLRRTEAKEQSAARPLLGSSSPSCDQTLKQLLRPLSNETGSTGGVSLDVEGFIAAVVDAVNDLTIEGLNSMEEYLVQELDLKNEEERHSLKQGVDTIYSKAQDNLDENLHRWESICRDSYFNNYRPMSLLASSSEQRNGSKNCSKASWVKDDHEEMLDAELRSHRSQLVAAHREGAKMRGELVSLERKLALRREVLRDAMSLEESLDPDMLEEAMRSARLLKDSILKASNSQETTSCLQTQQLPLGHCSSEQSLEDQIFALKLPDSLEKGDPAIVSLLG